MRKIIIMEAVVLAVLLVIALALTLKGPEDDGTLQAQTVSTEQTIPSADSQTSAPPADTQPVPTTEPTAYTELTGPPTEPPTEPTEPFEMPEITWKTFPERQQVSAARAFVYDCQSESYIYTKGDPTEKLYIASITKLFAIDTAHPWLDPGEEIRVTSGPLSQYPPAASLAGLQSGDVLTVPQLYGCILLPSGNDAAYVMATAVGKKVANDPELSTTDAVKAFVEEMNRHAGELGLKNTHFENPVGFHSETHYTCFDDLVTISQRTLENESVMQYTNLPKVTVTPVIGREKKLENTNALVNPNSSYYCPYAIGLKTGHTIAAEYCLLSVFDIDGRQYIIGVFGCPGYYGRYSDSLLLFNTKVILQDTQ